MSTGLEQVSNEARAGREAALVLQLAAGLIEETFDSLVSNALSAYRGGHLTAERALVFVGKLDAICGFRDELQARVEVGEVASATLNEARSAIQEPG